jgi:glucose/arabinose dehydrogenase
MKRATVVMAVLLVLAGGVTAQPKRPAGPLKVGDGFVISKIAEGLTAATAMDVAPDGRIFICEQTGALRVVAKGRLLEKPFLKVQVDSSWERGLIGVTFDPDFARNQFIYVTYISPTPYPHHVVSRFTAKGNEAAAGSEKLLLEGDNQQKMRGTIKNGHQGGALHFGHDGKLYISIGDQTSNHPSQDLDTLLGKIVRINSDGTIPADNPFYGETQGKYRAIWAIGCRNVFEFAVQPETGHLFLNDVGGAREEINVASRPGQNFGWPNIEHGMSSKDKYSDAIHSYPFASIVGGDFCTAEKCPSWPREFHGRYFFMDYVHGWIKTLDPAEPAEVREFATGLPFPTDLRFGPDGGLYVLVRDMWVNDKSFFKSGTGFVVKIVRDRRG